MGVSRIVAPLCVALGAAGCLGGVGRSLGEGAAEGLANRSDTLGYAGEVVIARLGRAFSDSVAPRLDSALRRLTAELEASSGELTDTVEASLRNLTAEVESFLTASARDSLREFMRRHTALLRSSVSTSLEEWSMTLAGELDGALRESGTRLAVGVVDSVSRTLASNLASGPLREAVLGLADSIVRQGILAAQDEGEKTGIPGTLRTVGIILGIVIVIAIGLGVGRFILALRRDKRQSEESLRVMGAVLKQRGERNVAQDVKQLALQQGVEPYLNDFLKRERLLIDDDKRAEESAEPGGTNE